MTAEIPRTGANKQIICSDCNTLEAQIVYALGRCTTDEPKAITGFRGNSIGLGYCDNFLEYSKRSTDIQINTTSYNHLDDWM